MQNDIINQLLTLIMHILLSFTNADIKTSTFQTNNLIRTSSRLFLQKWHSSKIPKQAEKETIYFHKIR